ncbi:MAG: rhomboid family intramembrane serine protease, partial [Muribaculaceae bacterium]|nr:rhomboid family intramembrane serine protease [Muribaculaceae bacterium]
MSIIDNFRNLPPVTKNLIIINVIIWLAMALVPALGMRLESFGALYYFTSDSFLPTQLLTYMFLHASFLHLFFNMFALFMFGNNMERVLGSPKFLFYYLTCG